MRSNLGWNIDAIVYDLFTGKVDRKIYEEVLSTLGQLDGLAIDEFGCGTGNLTRRFPATARVRAIDYSPIAVTKAKQKTNVNVRFFVMDFYEQQPNGYKPDRIVACRSLYHSDLSRSLGTLSGHLGDEGEVVVVHPNEDWKKYITPNIDRKRSFDFVQFVKSIGRVTNHFNVPYTLFSADEFEKIGQQHFDEVIVNSAAYDTHYLIQLRKGAPSRK